MTKLGELLKSEREKRGLSLHEIGMSLKINPKILKAIEDGDQANLPAKTFLRGFVKTYAQYLRLDVNQALEMFQEEYGATRAETPTPTQQATPQASSGQGVPRYESSLRRPDDAALPVASNNRLYTILITVVLVFLIGFVVKMMDKYQKESRDNKADVTAETGVTTTTTTMPVGEGGPVAAPSGVVVETTSTTTSLPSDAGSAAGVTAPTTTLHSGAALPVTTTSTTTSTTLKPVVTTTTVKAIVPTTTLKAAATTTTTTTVRPSVTTTTLAAGATTTTTLKGAMTEVIIEALNRITIRFSLNGGQKWESLELNPDQVHTFRSRAAVQLEISDGGAVNVIVNGRDRGVPGTIGKPLKLNYP
jgi:cytoskeleton protein RodZ